MNKNGKFFVPPPQDGSDFKELFKGVTAAGAGRSLGKDGLPAGPWTPELLAEAISQIDSNRIGVDLRTVQHWFQENEKGISTTNIRWLARVFGCNDPVATSQWQIELTVAQSRLVAKRRELKKTEIVISSLEPAQDTAEIGPVSVNPLITGDREVKRWTLAGRSEKLFSEGAPLNLAASIFAGMSALGFLSYIIGIHNVTFTRSDRVVKQVGFLWAPNWTLVFMVFLPLFLVVVSELVNSWKHEQRRLLFEGTAEDSDRGWQRTVDASSSSFWAVFLICVLFAGVFQWIGVCLMPLINGGGNYATDWGTIAIVRPEIVTIPVAIVFTAFAYLFMCLSLYLFFVGLILLYSVINDLRKLREAAKTQPHASFERDLTQTGFWVMQWVFRCTVLGMLIAIVMKLQSAYLASNGTNVVAWVITDLSSIFHERVDVQSRISYRMPTHYSSLLIAISTCFVFLYGAIRIEAGRAFKVALWKMAAVVVLLFASYLSVDAFSGFSILMCAGLLIGIYSLFDPAFGVRRASEVRNQSVS